jgi:fucose permease
MLNGSFGIGAVLGPIIVTVLGEHHFTLLYVGGAVLAIALVPETLRIPGRLPVALRATAGRPSALILIFVLAFTLYVGTEAGVGGWAPSHLESMGLGSASAAALTSGFWLALGLGRLLVALLPSRIPEWVIVTTASALGALSLLAAVSGRAAPIAYVVAGLVMAPIFPTGIVWLAKLLPRDARATSWLFPGAMLGGALDPCRHRCRRRSHRPGRSTGRAFHGRAWHLPGIRVRSVLELSPTERLTYRCLSLRLKPWS